LEYKALGKSKERKKQLREHATFNSGCSKSKCPSGGNYQKRRGGMGGNTSEHGKGKGTSRVSEKGKDVQKQKKPTGNMPRR